MNDLILETKQLLKNYIENSNENKIRVQIDLHNDLKKSVKDELILKYGRKYTNDIVREIMVDFKNHEYPNLNFKIKPNKHTPNIVSLTIENEK